MKELTKAEEQIMQKLWESGPSFIRNIVEMFPEPKPAYTTVATIIKILESKGFVEHENYGNIYKFYPLVLKDEYAGNFLNSFVRDYFEDSYSNMISFFSKEKKISLKDLEDIRKLLLKDKK